MYVHVVVSMIRCSFYISISFLTSLQVIQMRLLLTEVMVGGM
jgi:hypothetical protein